LECVVLDAANNRADNIRISFVNGQRNSTRWPFGA
jgi:hypothetical protein